MRACADAALVCGVGTALTIDLIDADGRHLGGRIAPSPTLMREVLHARAPQLPETGGDYVDFAADTEDALASGCEGAALALIERSLEPRASAWAGHRRCCCTAAAPRRWPRTCRTRPRSQRWCSKAWRSWAARREPTA